MSKGTIYRQTPCFTLYAPTKWKKAESIKKSPVGLKKHFLDRLRVFHFIPHKVEKMESIKKSPVCKKHFANTLRTPYSLFRTSHFVLRIPHSVHRTPYSVHALRTPSFPPYDSLLNVLTNFRR